MTEHDWLTCDNPYPLLGFLLDVRDDRKKRLAAVVACEEVLGGVVDKRSHEALAVARRMVDGVAGPSEVAAARRATEEVLEAAQQRWQRASKAHTVEAGIHFWSAHAINACLLPSADRSMQEAISGAGIALRWLTHPESAVVRGKWEIVNVGLFWADLLRDIFGNPFRPVEFDPRWRTADVIDLARAIEGDRAFDRMPILGDALMDAGCDSEEIIGHCRSDGRHVRGCWVVDRILGDSTCGSASSPTPTTAWRGPNSPSA